jgi:hypothetical protein
VSKGAILLKNLLAKGRKGRDDKGVHKSAGTKEKDITEGEVRKDMGIFGGLMFMSARWKH